VDGYSDLKLLHLSWETIQLLAEEVAARIRESGYAPDLIVAVSRGGFDHARILCDQLEVRRLASVQIEYYTGVNETNETLKIVYPLNADVLGKKVLVVDDVYPWEPIECMSSIAEKLENDGLRPHEIRKRLAELGFDPKVVNRLP
jgi:hypoxanthine phosphoribosyltransferase